MNRILVLLVLAVALMVSGAPVSAQEPQAGPPNAATIFAIPIHGGCYIVGPNQCRFHADPFLINISSGVHLVAFRIVAYTTLGTTIYDFRTDVSNPPAGNYTPSLPAEDYAARCGVTYYLNLQGKDDSNVNYYSLGVTGTFTCPAAVP